MSSQPKVLIVGSGPSGLVAALTLARNGIPIRIIEKESDNRIGIRGSGLTARSLELYYFLGAHKIEETQRFSMKIRKHVGGDEPDQIIHMMKWVDPTPNNPYLTGGVLGQCHVERILRSYLSDLGVKVELGTALRSFTQNADHVAVELATGEETSEQANFDFVIGADGARGVVRKQLGLSFLGENRNTSENMTMGDVRIDGLDRSTWHLFGDWSTAGLSLNPDVIEGSDVFQFITRGDSVNHELLKDPTEVVKHLYKLTGLPTGAVKEIIWTSEYRPNIRMVDKFSEGRVFVVGDAAHVHSPAGGQGGNSSIQDSFNLAWKIALVCQGRSSPSLLNSYNEERLPVITQMLSISTAIHEKMVTATSTDSSRWERGGSILQLGVNYRGSSILVDERNAGGDDSDVKVDSYTVDGFVRAGDRAPDAPGLGGGSGPSRLFDIFKPYHHTVLFFAAGDEVERVKSVIQTLQRYPPGTIRSVILYPQGASHDQSVADLGADFVLEDQSGHAFEGYGVLRHASAGAGLTVVAVRPDGVIGAIAYGVEGVHKYFDIIFASV